MRQVRIGKPFIDGPFIFRFGRLKVNFFTMNSFHLSVLIQSHTTC